MVAPFVQLTAALSVSLLAELERSPLSRLPPRTQFKVVGILILLTIGGVALVVLSWMMLRAGRRAWRRDDTRLHQRNRPLDRDDWARHPLPGPPDPPHESPDPESE